VWQPNLNKFVSLGRPAWKEARATLQKLLSGMCNLSCFGLIVWGLVWKFLLFCFENCFQIKDFKSWKTEFMGDIFSFSSSDGFYSSARRRNFWETQMCSRDEHFQMSWRDKQIIENIVKSCKQTRPNCSLFFASFCFTLYCLLRCTCMPKFVWAAKVGSYANSVVF